MGCEVCLARLHHFTFQRGGRRYTGSTPLFAFVRDHKAMMAELQKQ